MKKIFLTFVCFLFFINACLADTVSFNVKSHKIHNLNCQYSGCKNCIKIERQKAIKKGGVPCKVCGG